MGKRSLGKGLNELLKNTPLQITDEEVEELGVQASIIEVPLDRICPNPKQPRVNFDIDSLNELADSMREHGLVQPLLVRPDASGNYELVAGERRWRAAALCQLETVPVIVRELTDEKVLVFALVENLQREDLNIVEEAEAYGRLCEEFNFTHEQIGLILGKARSTVTNLLRLRELLPRVLVHLREGDIEVGHAKLLVGLPKEKQLAMAHQIVKRGLSVRQTERLLRSTGPGVKPPSGSNEKDPDVLAIENELTGKLGVPTAIRLRSKQKGEVVLKFHSLDELDGVLEHLRR